MKDSCRHGTHFYLRCASCEKEHAEIGRQAAVLRANRAKNQAPSTSAPLAAARQEESDESSQEKVP